MKIVPTQNGRKSSDQMFKTYFGKKFTRRRDGHQRTLTVIDVTYGGDVVVRQRGYAREFMHQSLFLQWLL